MGDTEANTAPRSCTDALGIVRGDDACRSDRVEAARLGSSGTHRRGA